MQPPVQVTWVVEDDPSSAPRYSKETLLRTYIGAVITLSLGVLSSTVLSVPFAVSRVGLLAGCLTMAVVAWANDVTSCLLVRAAAYTGLNTYESLAEWAGGKRWKRTSEISLLVLLSGTLLGGMSLLSDLAGHISQLAAASTTSSPTLLLSGPAIFLSAVLLVLLPMCLLRRIRQLEGAATCAVVMVLVLLCILSYDAVASGFPAVRDGSLPVWSISVDEHLAEAFTIIGLAFYLQPMMMPLLAEMPQGPAGSAAMKAVVRTTLYGVALVVYTIVGAAGASLFGPGTADNILVNPVVAGRNAEVALCLGMMVYLALAMTTTHYALRQSLDAVLFGPDAPYTRVRHLTLTCIILGLCSAVAIAFPGAAAQIFDLTGATAMCVVCYITPVYVHFKVRAHERAARKTVVGVAACSEAGLSLLLDQSDGVTEPLLPGGADVVQPARWCCRHKGSKCCGGWCSASNGWVRDVVVPVVVLVLGISTSSAALYVSVRDVL